MQHLINDKFHVSFRPAYLLVFLEKLGLSYHCTHETVVTAR
jgi:hypothetical protein